MSVLPLRGEEVLDSAVNAGAYLLKRITIYHFDFVRKDYTEEFAF